MRISDWSSDVCSSDLAQAERTPAICCHIGYHQKCDRGYPRTDDIIGSENVEACGEPKINGCERQPRPRRSGYARHKAGGLMWLIICINIGIAARKAESAAYSVRQGNDTSELGHGRACPKVNPKGTRNHEPT